MSLTSIDRHIDCDGVFNLRDLGGYPTSDGRRVRWRTVFRADGLHRATNAELPAAALGWRTVIDLRTHAEHEAGRYAGAAVHPVHLPMLQDIWDATSFDVDLDDVIVFLTDRYLEMAVTGAAAIGTAFELLASPERLPAVFHCSAGKDRTGVLAALVLTTLGVDDDHIAADYHLSAAAMDRLVDWITANRPEVAEHMARQPQAFLACPPEAIAGFLDALRARHGSTDGYLASIGVTSATLDALRAVLLEDG